MNTNKSPLFKSGNKTETNLTTDQMVFNILAITTVGLFLLAFVVFLAGDNPFAVWNLVVSALLSVIAMFLAKRGRAALGRVLIPSQLTFVITSIAYAQGGLHHISIVGFPIVIVLAGLLLGIQGTFIFATIASIAAIIVGFADIKGLIPAEVIGYEDFAIATLFFFMTAGVLRVIMQRLVTSLHEAEANTQAQEKTNIELQRLQKELEERVETRTTELQTTLSQMQTIAQVSRSIASIQNLDELLTQVTTLISESFGVYHTGIFLLDDRNENAVLQAANSSGGHKMLDRGHRLRIGAEGIVGYVTSRGQARIALDVGEDAVYFDNPDMPETRSEIALPLMIAGKVEGALDLQSTEANAFRDDDIQTLSILADQVATAIQNVRLLEQSLKSAQETEKAYSQMTGQAWGQYSAEKKILGFEYDGAVPRPITEPLKDDGALAIPLVLRGQTIGKIKLSPSDPNRGWTEDELAKAQAAAERTSLALESARLLEDAQRRAATEQAIGEISAKIGATTKIDEILRSTVQELGIQLGDTEIMLELESDQD